MRNGGEAIIERVKKYEWGFNGHSGSIELAEGVHCGSWILGMWTVKGQSAPSQTGQRTPFDLIERLS